MDFLGVCPRATKDAFLNMYAFDPNPRVVEYHIIQFPLKYIS
jgi:hypothetical protein